MNRTANHLLCDSSGKSYHIRRLDDVDEDCRKDALSVLLTGKDSRIDDPSVFQFLQYAREQRMKLDNLWALYPEQTTGGKVPSPVATVLIVASAGRTAMLFVSKPHGLANIDLLADFTQTVCQAQIPDRIRLIQALLDTDQYLIRKLLEQAGFRYLATLQYMRGRTLDRPIELDLQDPAYRMLHYSTETHDAFAHVIHASYEMTLDCPGLVGLRSLDDIIAGHKATGRFEPELWFAIFHGEAPVGVMLINEVPSHRAHELVYLGLAAPWRGRGIARKLLEYALATAYERGSLEMLLAVDQNNAPAVHLYTSLGFEATIRKYAMIFTLE